MKNYTIEDFNIPSKKSTIKTIISQLFYNLALTNKSGFVTISKTLHFLHPQLMIPIDRTYTANYFHDYTQPDVPKKKDTQIDWSFAFHQQLSSVYKKHQKLFDEISKDTKYPITKLLDNMLIGFAMYRNIYINRFDYQFIIL